MYLHIYMVTVSSACIVCGDMDTLNHSLIYISIHLHDVSREVYM